MKREKRKEKILLAEKGRKDQEQQLKTKTNNYQTKGNKMTKTVTSAEKSVLGGTDPSFHREKNNWRPNRKSFARHPSVAPKRSTKKKPAFALPSMDEIQIKIKNKKTRVDSFQGAPRAPTTTATKLTVKIKSVSTLKRGAFENPLARRDVFVQKNTDTVDG